MLRWTAREISLRVLEAAPSTAHLEVTRPRVFPTAIPEVHRLEDGSCTVPPLMLDDSASSPIVRQFAAFRAQMAVDRNLIKTFETGTSLLVMNEDNGQHKLEIDLERDDLMSDLDELEVLSVRTKKECRNRCQWYRGSRFR